MKRDQGERLGAKEKSSAKTPLAQKVRLSRKVLSEKIQKIGESLQAKRENLRTGEGSYVSTCERKAVGVGKSGIGICEKNPLKEKSQQGSRRESGRGES